MTTESFDPTEPELGQIENYENEWSVEDVARSQEIQASEFAEAEEPGYQASELEPAESETAAARLPIRPIQPMPIQPRPIYPIKRLVSGRYRSPRRSWQLELRVDVDGRRPMRKMSGDYFRISGRTTSYYGSFIVNAISLRVTSSLVTITGIATMTWNSSYRKLVVTIPRRSIFSSPAPATARWMTTSNQPGATYTCYYESPYFRTVDLEQDRESGVTPFSSYNTGSLPSGGPARTLSVSAAYAEAGIQMRTAGFANVVPVTEAGADQTWNNAELHNAMVRHFSLWREAPQWKVWLFHAQRHVIGPGLLGIMFDQQGRQRQGCATFYQRIAGTSASRQRDQLYVCVHELGHCFNLYHSFHKQYMNPPKPNRLSANSWMNYPQNYPGGRAAFWSAFSFQFDNLETIHLRHAFRNNVIIGGNPFGTGAALEDREAFANTIEDDSGLNFVLDSPSSFAFGEPVVVEIKMYATDRRGKQVHKHLHPNYGFVQIAIQKPGGEMVVYEPPLEHCVETETVNLDETNPAIYESAYVGYEKHSGQVFDQPGVYRLRGAYSAIDGSIVMSNVLNVLVRTPLNADDEEMAELLLGDDQGMLLYLLGSDSDSLKSGNDALELAMDKHADHPLTVYAQLIKGVNKTREFKEIEADNKVKMRKPEVKEAQNLISAVVAKSKGDAGVDNITLNMTMRELAMAQKVSGDTKGAKDTMKQMVDLFTKKKLSSHVLELIKNQAKI